MGTLEQSPDKELILPLEIEADLKNILFQTMIAYLDTLGRTDLRIEFSFRLQENTSPQTQELPQQSVLH